MVARNWDHNLYSSHSNTSGLSYEKTVYEKLITKALKVFFGLV